MGSLLTIAPRMSEVAAWIVHIVSTDPQIIDHCTDTFGKPPVVFHGTLAQQMPDNTVAPFIAIERDRHIGGTGAQRKGVRWETYRFILAVGVEDAILSEVTPEDATTAEIVTVDGVLKAEDLAYLVRDRLDERLPAQLVIDMCEVVALDTVSAPLFVHLLELQISTPMTMGGCPVVLPTPS